MTHGIALEYTQDRQFIYAKMNPVLLRRALEQEPAFEVLLFDALETIGYSSFAYQLDMEQLEDLSHMPWHTLRQTLVRRIATRTEFTLDVRISPDKMEAKARLQRAFSDEKVSEEGLIERLAEYGVVAGIDPSAFVPWVQGDQNADDEFCVVAVGQLPVAGQDEHLVPLQDKLWVTEGTLLARHEQATDGVAGYTVDGQALPAIKGRPHPIVIDKYCRVKDHLIYAEISGVLMCTPFVISLSPLHQVSQEMLLASMAEDTLSALTEKHESLCIAGDLCEATLTVDGHLWVLGDCERVRLTVGGHLFIQGALRGPSFVQVGGCFGAAAVRESTLLVAQGVYAQELHTTQIFSGQGAKQHPSESRQSVWHSSDHAFFENERQRLSIENKRLQLQIKVCVQQLIEARKQQNALQIDKFLLLSQRLQRRRFFLEAALVGYAHTFEAAFVFDPVLTLSP